MWWRLRDGHRRRLQEALADCLQALEEGASARECLTRYPDLAAELEPLLHTAAGLRVLSRARLPDQLRQEDLRRFLAALAQRRPYPLAAPSQRARPGWRWAPAALAAAITGGAVAAVVVATAVGGPGGGQEIAGRVTPAPTPTQTTGRSPGPSAAPLPPYPQVVQRVEELVTELELALQQGQDIQLDRITELKQQNDYLVQGLDPSSTNTPDSETLAKVQQITARQQEVLPRVREVVPPEVGTAVDETLRLAEAGQLKVTAIIAGEATPTTTPAPTPSPTLAPTPAPTPTPTTTPTPQATATPSPSPEPTGTPTPTAEPTLAPAVEPTTSAQPTPEPTPLP